MSNIRNVIRSSIRSPVGSIFNTLTRPAYNFDGVDDRGQLQFRAINPDGDIDIEWRSGSTVNLTASRTIISQTLTTTQANQEFFMFVASNGNLAVRVGGVERGTNPAIVYQPNTKYRWRLQGTVVNLWINDVIQPAMSLARGAAREPSAVTQIGAAANAFFYLGQIYDLKINGVLYPMNSRNQSVLIPSPSGLGTELATPEVIATPNFKGSQWTYLGDGRWQYVGDGTYNELILINPALQPQAGFVEFEVESISGVMRTYTTTSQVGVHQSSPVFTTTGKFRHFVTSRSGVASGTYFSFVRSNTGQAASCIIKNISFKPLISAYGEELIQNGGFSSATGWATGTGATITNNELQINSAVVANATQTIPTVNGRLYEMTFTVKSISSGSVRAILYGNGIHYVGPNRNAVGTYTELVTFNTLGGSYNNAITIQGANVSSTVAVVDDVSVREVLGFCNPLTLSNTTSDRWTEIEE